MDFNICAKLVLQIIESYDFNHRSVKPQKEPQSGQTLIE
jgi:hypothetical protein